MSASTERTIISAEADPQAEQLQISIGQAIHETMGWEGSVANEILEGRLWFRT